VVDAFAQVLQQLINGIALGGIYALISLGYTMVYGIVRLINFAHGDLLTVGAFIAYFILTALGVTPLTLLLAFVAAMALTPVLGVTIERLAYRPLRNAPKINSLITAIGVSLLLENLMRVLPFIGTDFRRFPTLPTQQFNLMETINAAGQQIAVTVSQNQLIVLVVAALLMIGLIFVVDYTKTGKAMRSAAFPAPCSADFFWVWRKPLPRVLFPASSRTPSCSAFSSSSSCSGRPASWVKT